MKKKLWLCLLFIIASALIGCNLINESDVVKKEYQQVRSTFFPMDTMLDIVVQAQDKELANEAINQAKKEVDRLESMLSATIETSEVSRINQNAGIEPVKVSEETFELFEMGLKYAGITQGKFDITIAPILNLYHWRDGKVTGEKPSDEELKAASQFVDFTKVELDKENSTVFLAKAGMEVDLGGIAKGYIIDQAAEILADHGLEYGYINGGGDIRFLGPKHDGTPWKIGVTDPRANGNIAVISAEENALVTSGDYERYYLTKDGERIHHIIDPHTGLPANHVMSVTVIAEDATTADIMSTAFFMFPAEQSLEMAKQLGVEVLIVTLEGEILMTEKMQQITTITQ